MYLRDAERTELRLPRTPSIHSNNVTPGLGKRRIFFFKAPSTKAIVDIFSSTVRLVVYHTPPFVEGTHKTVAQLRLCEQQYGGCYQANALWAGAQFNHFPYITQQQQTFPDEESRVVFQNMYSGYIFSNCIGPFPLSALLEC